MNTEAHKLEQQSLWKNFLLPILFGLAFGFLLQKAGVAKYRVLMGVLLFQDATVVSQLLWWAWPACSYYSVWAKWSQS